LKQEQLRLLEQALRHQQSSHSALIRFASVSGAAYLLYQAVLFLTYDSALLWFLPAKDTRGDIIFLKHPDVRLLIATLVASALTLVGQFAGHDLWTFRDRASLGKPLWMRFGQFVATILVGAGIVAVTVNVLTVRFDMYHFVALPIGVALVGGWNWLLYSLFIWRRPKENAPS